MSSYSDKTLKNKMLNNSNGKCGEITFCIQVGKRVYALNCLYCSQICLQWDMFINHMEQMHDAELNSEYPLHAENESELQISDCQGDFGRPSAVQHKVATNTEFNSTDTCHLDDPLEEDYYLNPSSIPVKVEEFDYTPNEIIMDDRGVTATNSQIDKEITESFSLPYLKMSHNNLFTSEDFQYKPPTNNLTTSQNVYVPYTDGIQNPVLKLLEEVKSLKSEISDMKKETKELKDGNKRSFTKLTEEVIAVKLENRKHHDDNISIDEHSVVRKLPLVAIADLEKFDYEVQQDEDKLRQFKQFIAKTGGEGPAPFIRAAVRKVFSDELASLYSWKGTSTKPSGEKVFLITIIKAICHLKYKCTDKDMNAVLQKHFVHAKDRMTKKKNPN